MRLAALALAGGDDASWLVPYTHGRFPLC
jgi:hypothetical protein